MSTNTDIANIPTDTGRTASRTLRKVIRTAIAVNTCGFMALGALIGGCQGTGKPPVPCKQYIPEYGTLFGYDYQGGGDDVGTWYFPNGKVLGYSTQEDSIIYQSKGCALRSPEYVS